MDFQFLLYGSFLQFLVYFLVGHFNKTLKIQKRILIVAVLVYFFYGVIMTLIKFENSEAIISTGVKINNPFILVSILGSFINVWIFGFCYFCVKLLNLGLSFYGALGFKWPFKDLIKKE